MLIYAGKTFTATQRGQRLETVACEKCKTTYYYELTRTGVGRSSSHYVGQNGAQQRAADLAAENLDKRLANEAEMVPCPKCNWVNVELVERYRRRRFRMPWATLTVAMMVSVIVGPLVGAAVEGPVRDGFRTSMTHNASIVMYTIIGVGLLSPIWMWLILSKLKQGIDPNATYPRRPILPVGTPPALVETKDPQTGEPCLAPARNAMEELRDADGWLVLPARGIQLAPVCCVCLAEATTKYKSPFRLSSTDGDVALPLCKGCSWALWRNWWMVALVVVAACAGLAALGGQALHGASEQARWALPCMGAFFAALFGMAIVPNKLCRPYQIKMVDGDRGIVKFKARNAEYTSMLAALPRRAA